MGCQLDETAVEAVDMAEYGGAEEEASELMLDAERTWGIEELKDAIYSIGAKSASGEAFGGQIHRAKWRGSLVHVAILPSRYRPCRFED